MNDQLQSPGHAEGSCSESLDVCCRAHGYQFDQEAFVASQRSERARRFLELFRHSQMYEVFITERLKLAAEGYEGAGSQRDAFEQKVTSLQNRMTGKKLGKTLVTASAKSVSNLTSMLRNAGQTVRVSASTVQPLHASPSDAWTVSFSAPPLCNCV